jgi:hypothetical protein
MTEEALGAAYLLRKYGSVVSDEECKEIRGCCESSDLLEAIRGLGPPFNKHEASILAAIVGDMDQDHSFDKDGNYWRDDVLDKYAEYVHNYEYKYNQEALKVDPNTDTEETHIGPMAQDLEQVNPAVVKEDLKSGYKTVDTGRLALMNAGAIAELARKVQELENE